MFTLKYINESYFLRFIIIKKFKKSLIIVAVPPTSDVLTAGRFLLLMESENYEVELASITA
jgi:hypothetical protein